MIILVGKTCSGKSTIANLLEQKYGIHRIRTYTTRPRRDGEADEYHFISEAEFNQLRADDFFFETTSYTVASGDIWYYGTAKEELCDNCCIIMNPDGIVKIKHMLDDDIINPVIIFLNATEGVIWDRLRKRGQDSDEAQRRIRADKEDFGSIDEYYDYAITTNDLTPDDIAEKIIGLIK